MNITHASDCAMHNEPAYPAGACDCTERTKPTPMEITSAIKKVADDLYWCARERYTSDEQLVLRGGNELVSLYARPTADEAADLVRKMNETIDPIRKRRVDELVAKLRGLADDLAQSDY